MTLGRSCMISISDVMTFYRMYLRYVVTQGRRALKYAKRASNAKFRFNLEPEKSDASRVMPVFWHLVSFKIDRMGHAPKRFIAKQEIILSKISWMKGRNFSHVFFLGLNQSPFRNTIKLTRPVGTQHKTALCEGVKCSDGYI